MSFCAVDVCWIKNGNHVKADRGSGWILGAPLGSDCSTSNPKKKQMAVGQNLVPLVNIKIAGKWMFIPLKMVLIGIDPYPNDIANETCAIVCHPRHKKKWGLVMSIF